MKTMNLWLVLAVGLTVMTAQAQRRQRASGPEGEMGGPPMPKLSQGFEHILGVAGSFTAKAEMEKKGGDPKEAFTMSCQFAMSEGNVRMEMDMTQIGSKKLKASDAQQMKEMGMSQIVSISRAKDRKTFVVYPGLAAYVELKPEGQSAEAVEKPCETEKKPLGTETAGGRACSKSAVTVKCGGEAPQEFILWSADDLGGFPVQIEFKDGADIYVWRYKDIKKGKVDDALFQPAAGMTRYGSLQEMVMQSMMKKLQSP